MNVSRKANAANGIENQTSRELPYFPKHLEDGFALFGREIKDTAKSPLPWTLYAIEAADGIITHANLEHPAHEANPYVRDHLIEHGMGTGLALSGMKWGMYVTVGAIALDMTVGEFIRRKTPKDSRLRNVDVKTATFAGAIGYNTGALIGWVDEYVGTPPIEFEHLKFFGITATAAYVLYQTAGKYWMRPGWEWTKSLGRSLFRRPQPIKDDVFEKTTRPRIPSESNL